MLPTRPRTASKAPILVLLLAVVVVLPLVAAVQPASAAVATRPVSVMTFNYSGDSEQHDVVSSTNDLVSELQTYHPAAVMLEEVCFQQYQNILNSVNSAGLTYSGTAYQYFGDFTVLRSSYCNQQGATGDTDFGNAILAASTTGTTPLSGYQEELLTPGSDPNSTCDSTTDQNFKYTYNCEVQKVACATVAAMTAAPGFQYATDVCDTHIIPNDNDSTGNNSAMHVIPGSSRAAQTAAAAEFAIGFGSSMPLVFGGDFNADPSSSVLNDVYYRTESNAVSNLPNGTSPPFEEADQCGKAGNDNTGQREEGPGVVPADPTHPYCNQVTHWDGNDRNPQDASTSHPRKYDYIFFKQAYWQVYRTDSHTDDPTSHTSDAAVDTNNTYSDHVPLIGQQLIECSTSSGCSS